jgi:hypothetical protein
MNEFAIAIQLNRAERSDCRGIRSDHEKRHIAQVQQASEANHDIQAERQHDVDANRNSTDDQSRPGGLHGDPREHIGQDHPDDAQTPPGNIPA